MIFSAVTRPCLQSPGIDLSMPMYPTAPTLFDLNVVDANVPQSLKGQICQVYDGEPTRDIAKTKNVSNSVNIFPSPSRSGQPSHLSRRPLSP